MTARRIAGSHSVLIPRKTLELVESGNLRAVSCVEGAVPLAGPESKTGLRKGHDGIAFSLRQIAAFESCFAFLLSSLEPTKGLSFFAVQIAVFRFLRLVLLYRQRNTLVLYRLGLTMLTGPASALQTGFIRYGALNVKGQQHMGAVSCMKHLGLLGVHIIIIRPSNGVLIAIPKCIQKLIVAAGTRFIPLSDWSLKRSVCRQVTIIRKQLAIRVVQ